MFLNNTARAREMMNFILRAVWWITCRLSCSTVDLLIEELICERDYSQAFSDNCATLISISSSKDLESRFAINQEFRNGSSYNLIKLRVRLLPRRCLLRVTKLDLKMIVASGRSCHSKDGSDNVYMYVRVV